VNPAPANALLQNLIWNVELNHRTDLLTRLGQQLIKHLCLLQSPREAIEDEATAAIRLGDSVLDDAHNDVITHQTTLFHDLLRSLAYLGSLRYSFPEHVPS